MSPIQFKRCLNQTLHAETKQEPGSPTNVKPEPAPGATPSFKRLKSGVGLSRLALELSSPLSGTRGGKKRPEPLGNAKKMHSTQTSSKNQTSIWGDQGRLQQPQMQHLWVQEVRLIQPRLQYPRP